MNTLWVGLGGALGSIARYHVGKLVDRPGAYLPWGTLTVNVVGSFLIALVLHVASRTQTISPTAQLALTTGVLGGFTTYSAFNEQTLAMARNGAWIPVIVYVLSTLVGCLAAGALGWAVAQGAR